MTKKVQLNPLERAYQMGYECFNKGGFNHPYDADSLQAKEWQRGFDTAYFDNKYTRLVSPHIELLKKHGFISEMT